MDFVKRHIYATDNLNEEQISQHRLAIDYAKVELEKKKFAITAFGAIVTTAGLLTGVYFSVMTQMDAQAQREADAIQIQQQKVSDLETQIMLRFAQMESAEQQLILVNNINELGGISDEFVQNLRDALSKSAIIPDVDPAESIENLTALAAVQTDILRLSGAARRQARKELSTDLAKCAAEICMPYLNDVFQVDDLRTSERYRVALGIAVAISSLEGSLSSQNNDFARLFADANIASAFKAKLEQLTKVNESAISGAALRALAKFVV